MSNRATLINKATLDYGASDIDSGLLASKYSIAVFWPSLFAREDMQYLDHLDAESGKTYRIPYLATDSRQALLRWNTRRRRFTGLSDKGKAAADAFDASLCALKKPYVILDTWGIWMMDDVGFDTFLLESIDQSEMGNLSEMMEQAGIREGQEEVHQYMGFAWNSGRP